MRFSAGEITRLRRSAWQPVEGHFAPIVFIAVDQGARVMRLSAAPSEVLPIEPQRRGGFAGGGALARSRFKALTRAVESGPSRLERRAYAWGSTRQKQRAQSPPEPVLELGTRSVPQVAPSKSVSTWMVDTSLQSGARSCVNKRVKAQRA